MIRDVAITSIRETLNLPIDSSEKAELISFQNTTLRPVLKFQNELLISLFRSYIIDRKMKWENCDAPTKKRYITTALSNDIHLKSMTVGCVVGLLNSDELKLFLQNQREISRRIIAMAKERLIDQLINK